LRRIFFSLDAREEQKYGTLQECACHPCAGGMVIFEVKVGTVFPCLQFFHWSIRVPRVPTIDQSNVHPQKSKAKVLRMISDDAVLDEPPTFCLFLGKKRFSENLAATY